MPGRGRAHTVLYTVQPPTWRTIRSSTRFCAAALALPADLEAAADGSTKVGDEDTPTTSAGSAATCSTRAPAGGTVCIYQATSPEAIRKSVAADLPVDEIIEIADTVIVRPDPQPAAV
jgi:hypothetical protein